MKSFFATIGIIALVGMMIVGLARAADPTAEVTATVTVQQVALTVTPGTVAYGTLATSGTKDTTSGGVNATQQANNTGNVNVDFDVMGIDVTGTCTWELADTQSSEQYFHKYCTTGAGSPDPCDTTPTWNAMNEDTYTEFATGIAPSGNKRFDLQIGVPSSTTCMTEVNVNVWVQASAS